MNLFTILKQRLAGAATEINRSAVAEGDPVVKTQFSATVFSGQGESWVQYLASDRADRYEEDICLSVLWSDRHQLLSFREETTDSRPLAACLNDGFAILRDKLRAKPHAERVFQELVFGNQCNGETDLYVRCSETLPSEASREVQFDDHQAATAVTIVLQTSLVQTVLEMYAGVAETADADERLGYCWPLVRRVLSQLGYPNYPRDRYVEKIDLVTQMCVVSINVMFDEQRERQLVPNRIGRLYQEFISRRDDIKRKHLFRRHPYFRLLNELAFMLDEQRLRGYGAEAKIYVREYLDERYLRLSLAGVMPAVTEWMVAREFEWKKRRVVAAAPAIGSYGVLDQQDLKAWRKVEGPFEDMGFTLLRQVGMGEFGRVYEALNHSNPNLPHRVALKVDRIRSWQKPKDLLDAETTLQISRDLAASPHVIRIFDAGKLGRKKYTFHVLQFIDGDTLDNLLGVTGAEHSSIHRPLSPHTDARHVGDANTEALRGSAGESWRRRRLALPFAEALSLSQTLDLLTSLLLWLEEIHHLGYANNDLKNGNLMVSRRGQVKGIDMDSYSPTFSPLDRVTDFYFLAVSLMLFFLNLSSRDENPKVINEDDLRSRDTIRDLIDRHWPFRDVQRISRGRAENAEVVDLLADIIHRSRNQSYAREPEEFTAAIDRLIHLKRTIFAGEIVLD
jgi:hypothetical protein